MSQLASTRLAWFAVRAREGETTHSERLTVMEQRRHKFARRSLAFVQARAGWLLLLRTHKLNLIRKLLRFTAYPELLSLPCAFMFILRCCWHGIQKHVAANHEMRPLLASLQMQERCELPIQTTIMIFCCTFLGLFFTCAFSLNKCIRLSPPPPTQTYWGSHRG